MAFIKKYKTYKNKENKLCSDVGVYTVTAENTKVYSVKLNNYLVTTKHTWQEAVKLAELLDEAYRDGQDIIRFWMSGQQED